MSTIKSSAENLTLNADGANNDIKFQSNGSEVASIDQAGSVIAAGTISSTGDTTITNGDIVFATAGKGICLGVTSNTDANTLDDYEEGLHECTITMGTGSATLDGTKRYLRYTKIGRQVHVCGQILIASVSSPDGQMQISLPFTVSSAEADFSVGNYRTLLVDTPNDGVQAVIYSNRNTALANLEWSRDSADKTHERATNGGYYMFGLTYFT